MRPKLTVRGVDMNATKTSVARFVCRRVINRVLAPLLFGDFAISIVQSGEACRFVDSSACHIRQLHEFHFAVVQSAQTLRPDLRQRNSRRARTRKFRQNFVTINQITVCRMNAHAREFRLPFAGEDPQPDYRYKFGAEGFRPKSADHNRHRHRRVVQCESLLTLR